MRTRYSILNVSIGIISQLVITILGFIGRHYFVVYLGIEMQGVSATIISIISMLSLTELGIGTAIVCNLYKPLAENDQPKIISLMQLFSTVYKIIALVILCIGLAVTPFLNALLLSKGVNVNQIDPHFLLIIYMLFLTDTVISYLLTHKRSIIYADQKAYIITFIHTCMYVALFAGQLAILILTKNFIIYLLFRMISSLSENVIITLVANKKYPYITTRKKIKIEAEIKYNIIKNTKALALHYTGIYLINGTDMIIINKFLGFAVSGIYSNYLMIITVLRGILSQFSTGITASFGNMYTSKDKDTLDIALYKVLFITFILANFSTASLFCLFNPFISLWINPQSLLSWEVVLIIVIIFYVTVMSEPLGSVRAGAGMFGPDRFLHIALAAVNLIISVILIQRIGIIGVFFGTLICLFIKEFTVLPIIVYKNIFHKSMWEYYRRLISYFTVTIISILATWFICSLITIVNPWISLILKIIICCIVPNGIAISIFHKSVEVKNLIILLMKILKIKNNHL